jgi:hypothetical protein
MLPPDGKFGLGGKRHPPPKSTEQRELEKLQNEMKATAALRERNKARMLQAATSSSGAAASVRSMKKLTIPKPFNFRSEATHSSSARIQMKASASASSIPAITERGRSRTRSLKTNSVVSSFAGPRARSRSLSIQSARSEPVAEKSLLFTPLSIQTKSFFSRRSESKSQSKAFTFT